MTKIEFNGLQPSVSLLRELRSPGDDMACVGQLDGTRRRGFSLRLDDRGGFILLRMGTTEKSSRRRPGRVCVCVCVCDTEREKTNTKRARDPKNREETRE